MRTARNVTTERGFFEVETKILECMGVVQNKEYEKAGRCVSGALSIVTTIAGDASKSVFES